MLIFNKTVVILGCAWLLVSCAVLRDDQNIQTQVDDMTTAWWVKTEFEPKQTTMLGLPLTRFDPEWVRAQRLHEGFLEGQLGDADYQAVLNSKLTFDLKHSIDDDPEQERFIVGIYQSRSGEKGRFLAVLEGEAVVEVLQYPGFAGYSALMLMDDRVYWYQCMECDDFDELEWQSGGYQLK